jgi:hypothetical protein
MFRSKCVFFAVALFVFSSGLCWAEGADLSTPKKAALEFAKGLETGDMAACKAASTGSDEEFKVVQVISGLVHSARDLRNSAVEKFGDAGKQILPGGDELTEFSKRVDSGTEKVNGDAATVGQTDERNPMKLKKSADGSWRVDLSSIPEKDQISKVMPKVQKVLTTGATEIKTGHYKTLEEAQNAISEQMFAAISEGAATRPAPGEAR